MSRRITLIVVMMLTCVSPLFADDELLLFGDEETDESRQEQQFLDAVPARVELPKDDLKTYVIDAKTLEVVRSFDGVLRDYWPDLDILLTESVFTVYYIDGVESLTPPPMQPGKIRVQCQGRDYDYRTTVTLWNRSTGEKIRDVTSDNMYGDSDETQLFLLDRKAFLWRSKAYRTDVVDLVTGEPVQSLPGYVPRFSEKDAFFILFHESDDISMYNPRALEPFCTVFGRRVRFSSDGSRFIAWKSEKRKNTEATVYELKTGKKIQSLAVEMETLLNRDGSKLLTRKRDPARVELWDVDAGKMLWSAPFGGSDDNSYSFRFSDDEKIVEADCDLILPAGNEDHPRTYVWNVETGKEIAVFEFFFMDRYIGKANRVFGSVKTDRRYGTKEVLIDTNTGEQISDKFNSSFVAASVDGRRFVTARMDTVYLWDSETGKPLGKFSLDGFREYRSSVTFDADPALVRIETPIKPLDSRFTAEVVWVNLESGDVVRREESLSGGKNRYENIVWKTDDENAVFWNLDENKPFFIIRLLRAEDEDWPQTMIGPIRFLPDGSGIIYSTKLLPWEQRCDI